MIANRWWLLAAMLGAVPIGCGHDDAGPIQETTSGTEVTFTLDAPGEYPYYCQEHFTGGMAGVVYVE